MMRIELLLSAIDSPLVDMLNLHAPGTMHHSFTIQQYAHMRDMCITLAVVCLSVLATRVIVVEEHQITRLRFLQTCYLLTASRLLTRVPRQIDTEQT